MNHSKFGLFDVLLYLFFICISVTIIYPFIYIINISLSDAQSVDVGKLMLLPETFSLSSYKYILSDTAVYWGYYNTLYRTIIGTSLSLVIILLAAYPLSKKHIPHRNFYTTFFVVTMFFSGGLIPSYLLIKNLGLMDNRLVLILPGLVNVYNLMIIRNFLMNIPAEMEESARIDGASDIKILFKILLPITKSALATVGLWIMVANWNAWFDSMIFIKSENKQVMQIFLRRLVIEASDPDLKYIMEQSRKDAGVAVTPETVKAAALMVTILPIIAVYPFLQKYFVKGVMLGSVKG